MSRRKISFFLKFQVMFFVFVTAYILSNAFSSVADFFEKYVALPIRGAISFIADLFRVPLFELIILSSPLLILLILYACLRRQSAKRALCRLVGLAECIFIFYIVSIGICANASGVTVSCEKSPSEEDYILAAEILACEVNSSFSEASPDFSSVETRISDYAEGELGISSFFVPDVKSSVMPRLYSRLNILGNYCFLTSEVIINSEQPSFLLGFTAAHELFHFFGIAREDEANLFAFAALSESDDKSLRYSAALTAYLYVSSVLYKINPEKYTESLSSLIPSARADIEAYREFIAAGNSDILKKASDAANSVLVSLKDKRGTESYGNTANLIVLYLCSGNE